MTIGLPTAKKLQLALLLLGIVALAVAAMGRGDRRLLPHHRRDARLVARGLQTIPPGHARTGRRHLAGRPDGGAAQIEAGSGCRAWAPRIAAGIALVSLLVAIRLGIFAAGGSDSYGYVSQASLWASGRLVTPDPLAALEPALGAAVAPMGYRLATTPGAIVPIYPPGLPMAMAVALKAGGATAVYYVVPLLGALAVWLTYLLGARVDRPVTGMMAAILVAFSPIFMFHTFEPMSDVPVTAWWLLAWVLALSPSQLGGVGAGLAVSAAVLTRPNLVPLAIVLAAVVAANDAAHAAPRALRRRLDTGLPDRRRASTRSSTARRWRPDTVRSKRSTAGITGR